MQVSITKSDNALNVAVSERLDTNTAPVLEKQILDQIEGITSLTLDMKGLAYISSAGLRVLLLLHKTMAAKGGNFVIKYPCDEVMEILDMTGFSSFLNIEE
ncbi:MAG: STAS domain-containing protein [Bacilli bacterium]|nr:STAS domain-containing protein [Bacilli bacterium]